MKDPVQMTFNELTAWLRDRLRMRGTAAADVNMGQDEAPYERPLELWNSGAEEFRNNFKRAILRLVQEAGATPWEPAHFHELGLLIEAADLWEAVGPLEAIAQSRRLLRHEHGSQLHMLALRTLLALRWKGTLDFWLSQKESVGNRWPAIVFAGLAQQRVDFAFDQLPGLVADREAMRGVLNLLPGLMREVRLGISEVRAKCRNVVGGLQPEAAEAMREWFRLQNCPLDAAQPGFNPGLLEAIRSVLGHQSAPRFRSASLSGAYVLA